MCITQNLTVTISSSSSAFLAPSNFNSRYFFSNPLHFGWIRPTNDSSLYAAGVRYHYCLWRRVLAFVNALLRPKKLRLVGTTLSSNLIIFNINNNNNNMFSATSESFWLITKWFSLCVLKLERVAVVKLSISLVKEYVSWSIEEL
jgi:hypothetical protein